MKIQDIKDLIEMVSKSGVAELNITDEDEAIHIERTRTGGPIAPLATATTARCGVGEPGVVDGVRPGDHIVRSPLVGTFHRADTPGAEPFVEIVDVVQGGDILGVISALKITNPIRTPAPGRISAILVEDEQPVEYDQPLFVISHCRETH